MFVYVYTFWGGLCVHEELNLGLSAVDGMCPTVAELRYREVFFIF